MEKQIKKDPIQLVGNLLKSARSASHEEYTPEQLKKIRQDQTDKFLLACQKECPSFSVSDMNRNLINEIFLYANGRSQVFDSVKGLWLYGPVGTGKSTIIQILRTYDFLSKLDDIGWKSSGGFGIVSASMVSNQFARKGLDGIDKYAYNNGKPDTWAFDEVGREPRPTKYFGTEMNVMQFVFQTRYEFRRKCLTHVTTNMPPEDITSKYGDYIADRVNEMFNVVEIKGESRR